MASKQFSKILLPSNTEKVLFYFHFTLTQVCPRCCCIQPSTSVCSLGVWDAEGGGGKTGAESAALHGFEINTAYDLYTFLKQHHSQPTNSYHESLHQVDKREFHYFPRGTFLAYHPRRLAEILMYHHASKVLFFKVVAKNKNCRPKALSAIKPYYTFAVRRTGLPEVKTIFQRRHFCPCAPCTIGDFHHCLYQAFLGRAYVSPCLQVPYFLT